MKYKVEVVERETMEIVDTIPAKNKQDAELIQTGIEINMNHREYFTRIVLEQATGS